MRKFRLLIHNPGILWILLIITACGEDSWQPKPKGYFRLDFPEKTYHLYEDNCPYSFEYPEYATIVPYQGNENDCWFNMDFPGQNARIHFSYFRLGNDLREHTEDSRTLAYKHTVKAMDIEENVLRDTSGNVYATIYHIYGNTASSVQFYITDSTSHFLRGALYFSSLPNADSLAPSIEFISKDIDHFLQTFEWKE